jgi:hypothetical protein
MILKNNNSIMNIRVKQIFFALFMLIPISELFHVFGLDSFTSSLPIFLAYLLLLGVAMWLMKGLSVNKIYQDSLIKNDLILLAKIGTISILTSFIFIIGILFRL